MSERFGDDRAPLDYGTGSNKSKIIGCPFCNTFKYMKENCIGFVCTECGKYVGESNFLYEGLVYSLTTSHST